MQMVQEGAPLSDINFTAKGYSKKKRGGVTGRKPIKIRGGGGVVGYFNLGGRGGVEEFQFGGEGGSAGSYFDLGGGSAGSYFDLGGYIFNLEGWAVKEHTFFAVL